MPALPGLTAVRDTLGRQLFGMVAGPDGPANRARIHDTPGPRWFAEDRPIRQVHGDASMFVGGLRALLLQSLHPLAMAGVAGHSDYKGDPWGRLQRTSTFLAVTTFGTADDAQRAVDKVRGIHRRVNGVAPTAVVTPRPIPTFWSGSTSPRSTVFFSPTSCTERRRSIRTVAMGTSPTQPASRRRSESSIPRAPSTSSRTDHGISTRAPWHRRSARGGPVPSGDSPAAAVGQGAVRRAGRQLRRHASVLGEDAAAVAVPTSRRSHRRPGGGPDLGGRYSLGDEPGITDERGAFAAGTCKSWQCRYHR